MLRVGWGGVGSPTAGGPAGCCTRPLWTSNRPLSQPISQPIYFPLDLSHSHSNQARCRWTTRWCARRPRSPSACPRWTARPLGRTTRRCVVGWRSRRRSRAPALPVCWLALPAGWVGGRSRRRSRTPAWPALCAGLLRLLGGGPGCAGGARLAGRRALGCIALALARVSLIHEPPPTLQAGAQRRAAGHPAGGADQGHRAVQRRGGQGEEGQGRAGRGRAGVRGKAVDRAPPGQGTAAWLFHAPAHRCRRRPILLLQCNLAFDRVTLGKGGRKGGGGGMGSTIGLGLPLGMLGGGGPPGFL